MEGRPREGLLRKRFHHAGGCTKAGVGVLCQTQARRTRAFHVHWAPGNPDIGIVREAGDFQKTPETPPALFPPGRRGMVRQEDVHKTPIDDVINQKLTV